MSKKSERLQPDWTSRPRGRRRVRPYVRKAANRAMVVYSMGIAVAQLLIMAMKGRFH